MTFILLCIAPLLGVIAQDLQPEAPSGFEERAVAHGKTMMVATSNPIASQVGFEVLEKGGNALDAVIAIQMVLNLVEPQSSGIGGGGLLLYYRQKDGEVIAYDGRETAPSALTSFQVPDIVGGASVGVPSILKMLEMAHQEEGELPWETLFEPAIKLSDEGFKVSKRLNRLIVKSKGLNRFPNTEAYFFADGKPKAVGTVVKNPALAHTLRTVAQEGTAPFYTGEIARNIVKTVREASIAPGELSMEDMASYEPIKRKPIKTEYHGYTVYGFPPPSAGGIAVAQILGMLSQGELENYDFGSAKFINLFSQASRAAYADRQQYVGDPAFTNVPVQHLLNPTYLHNVLKSPTKGAVAAVEHPSTSQICVIDQAGNAVAFTSSIDHMFGSALMVDGFLLNNQMTDFSSGPNRMEVGKRPMSSMAPTLVFEEDRLMLSVGSAGGTRIIDYVVKALLGVLDFGMNIQEAISFPNFVSVSEKIDLEKGTFLEKEVEALEKMGNQVELIPLTSGSQGIEVTSEGLEGGVDPRREGLAIGD